MFTGLVEGRGIVSDIRSDGAAIRLVIGVPDAGSDERPQPDESVALDASFDGGQLGESVAINGCCLTVVEIEGDCWSFQAGPETLAKTNLGELLKGQLVNLERSLPAGGRLGGHFVLGHVDGVAEVVAIEQDGEWITFWFEVSNQLAELMIPKGSVAVDGVSLTVVDVERDRFSVALIPHTLEVTTLGTRQVGDRVNIETDVLGKYVKKLLGLQQHEQ